MIGMRARLQMSHTHPTNVGLAVGFMLALCLPDRVFADSSTHDGAIYNTSVGDMFVADVFAGGATLTSLVDQNDRYTLNDLCAVTHPTKGKGVWFFGPYGWAMQFNNLHDEMGFRHQAPPYEMAACFFDVPKPQ